MVNCKSRKRRNVRETEWKDWVIDGYGFYEFRRRRRARNKMRTAKKSVRIMLIEIESIAREAQEDTVWAVDMVLYC